MCPESDAGSEMRSAEMVANFSYWVKRSKRSCIVSVPTRTAPSGRF